MIDVYVYLMCMQNSHPHLFIYFPHMSLNMSIFPPGEGHHADRRDTSHAGRGNGGRGLQRGAAAWQRGTLAGAGRDADGESGDLLDLPAKCKRRNWVNSSDLMS